MDVLVAGGHGQIGLRLLRLLAQRGDVGRGLIRKPEQAEDLTAAGAVAVVADWEAGDDITNLPAGSDAVVFAAGAGPGSGPERKRSVDYGGAVKLIEAAKACDVSRYVIVSSIGAQDPSAGGSMQPYLEAKHDADEALKASGLDYTIVRPGMLTDDPAPGHVDIPQTPGRREPIPRDDVAAVLLACLDTPSTIGQTFDLFTGDTPIAEALAAL